MKVCSRDLEFEEFVKNELGDIAVFDNGKYIGEKIPLYFQVWNKEFHPLVNRENALRKAQNFIRSIVFNRAQA